MRTTTVEPKHEKRFFTLAEANQRLPLVRAIVDDVVRLFRDVRERQQRLADLLERDPLRAKRSSSPYTDELVQMETDIRADGERLSGFAQELVDLGIELKDPEVGLVDFPTLVQGEEACLCWKLGEPEVGFWHDLKSGFQGRQSVADLLSPPRFASAEK